MIDDPYKELGVERGASQDEIKRAYRRKAKECHPDLHPNDPTATDRMNRINEAYDMLTHPEKYQAQRAQQQYQQAYQNPFQGAYGQQYGQGYSQGGYYDPFSEMFGFGTRQTYGAGFMPHEEAGDPPLFRMAVNDLNARQYQAAVTHLSQVLSTGRNARWYYLSALAEHGLGNSVRAMDYAQRAVQMEPNNQQYHLLLNNLRQAAQQYEQQAANHGFNVHFMSPDRICTTLCLANLFCNSCLYGRGCYFCC